MNNNESNEIYTNVNNAWMEEFTFSNVYREGTNLSVSLFLEVRIEDPTKLDFIDVFLRYGVSWSESLIELNPNSSSYYWEEVDVSSILYSWEKINDVKLKIQFNRVGGSKAFIYIRKAYLKVDFDILPSFATTSTVFASIIIAVFIIAPIIMVLLRIRR